MIPCFSYAVTKAVEAQEPLGEDAENVRRCRRQTEATKKMANGHTKTQLVPVKDSTHPFVQKALFEKALKRFFIGGFDPAHHTSADSLAWSMQFELDLYEEAEECELKTKRDINRARKFVQDFGKSEWVSTLKNTNN
jgi:hypothetical protein